MKDIYLIDGCTYSEGSFGGVTEQVHDSLLTAFFYTVNSSEGFEKCAREIAKMHEVADDPKNRIIVARTVQDIERAKTEGKKALIVTFQDPSAVNDSMLNLRAFYELGLRVMQMTYNKANTIGTGCVETNDGGLTDFGRAVLKKLNEWGVVADASHCGPATTMDVIKLSDKPVVISHAGSRVLTDCPRNKSDDIIKALKDNNGAIGLSSWGPLCWKKQEKRRPTMSDFVDHIEYVVDLIGIDHVGFGSDSTLDGTKDIAGTVTQATLYAPVVAEYDKYVGTDPEVRHAIGIKGPWDIGNVFEELKKRGYSEEDMAKFAGGNFLRVIKDNWK